MPVVFQRIQTVPIEDFVNIGADQRLVLVCRHAAPSRPMAQLKDGKIIRTETGATPVSK